MESTSAAPSAAPAITLSRPAWVVHPAFDLSFFIVPVFLGVLYGLVINPYPDAARFGNLFIYVVLGLSHFGSTWAFYLDRENLSYFSRSPGRFFVIPAVLIALSSVLVAMGRQDLVLIATYWFSGFHVMKQSTGMVALYRIRLGLQGMWERRLDNAAILGFSTYCLFGRCLERADFGYEAVFQSGAPRLAIETLGYGVGVVLALYAAKSVHRLLEHGAKAVPLLIMSIASVALFSPFLLTERYTDAFMASLAGHYCQYVGLVWLINRRKYTPETQGRFRSPALVAVSQNPSLLASVLLGYALVIFVLGSLHPLFPVVGLSWAHFFVDRYLFRFRDPFIRGAVLPYLMPRAQKN